MQRLTTKKPSWLKVKLNISDNYKDMKGYVGVDIGGDKPSQLIYVDKQLYLVTLDNLPGENYEINYRKNAKNKFYE